MFAFGGFEMGTVVAGSNPRQDLPVGMIVALGIVAVLCTMAQLVAIGVEPGLATSQRPLADAATVVLGAIVGRTFALAALMLLLRTMLTTLLLGTRMMYALRTGTAAAFFAACTRGRARR